MGILDLIASIPSDQHLQKLFSTQTQYLRSVNFEFEKKTYSLFFNQNRKVINQLGSLTHTCTLASNMVYGEHGIFLQRPQNTLKGAGWHCRKHVLEVGSAARGASIHEQIPFSRAPCVPEPWAEILLQLLCFYDVDVCYSIM